MKTVALLLALCSALSAATIRVQVNGRVVSMELEQYTAAALAGESSVFQSEEALKAMAVAARTYAVHFRGRHAAEGFDLCDTTHCQRINSGAVTPRVTAAVTSTAGELLWYQGKPAATYYTRDCGGHIEDARRLWPDEAGPYLAGHADPYCVRGGVSHWRWEGTSREIQSALQRSGLRTPDTLERIAITDRTPTNRARTLSLSGGANSVQISASTFRFAIGRLLGWNTLRSEQYNIVSHGDRIVFDGTGSGHGAGLCQLGAEQMGREKHSYREILSFYYPGTAVGLTAQGLAWQTMNGEHLTMLSTRPADDAATLALAERQLSDLVRRTHRPVPPVEIRVYPDVETFRNATGEPGWVAARASADHIDLQPAKILSARGVLESTLRHELAHAVLEANAGPNLPVWFREGLAAYFTAGPSTTGAPAPPDRELRQTNDEAVARSANLDAQRQVSTLVRRYGEGTVLGWLTSGLPRDVMNASAKQAPTKSK